MSSAAHRLVRRVRIRFIALVAAVAAVVAAATSRFVAQLTVASRVPVDRRVRDSGQATTEYALVMLAAALVALLVVAWATAGGGAGKIGQLFDRILDEVIGRV